VPGPRSGYPRNQTIFRLDGHALPRCVAPAETSELIKRMTARWSRSGRDVMRWNLFQSRRFSGSSFLFSAGCLRSALRFTTWLECEI